MNAIEHLVHQTLNAQPIPDLSYMMERDNEYGPAIDSMRARRLSYREIGEVLNLSHATVRNIYNSWKSRSRDD